MTRRICYVSGSRADFGLMQSTLAAIDAADSLELSIVVTGMHLCARFGDTAREIEASGLPIGIRIPVDTEPATGATMARNIGRMLIGIVAHIEAYRPQIMLLLGDRGEMLAGALAGLHTNVPVMHIHGGERSGTVDEPVRHAISKLSHFHCAATTQARERLCRMGEREDHIWVTGAPGLDGIERLATLSRTELARGEGFDPARPIALLVYHPVLQQAASAGADAALIVGRLLAHEVQVIAMAPNSDAGSAQISDVLGRLAQMGQIRLRTHLGRERFVSWMAAADIMIGNSSAGIIEAASFGTPVLDIGPRQNLRERNDNVTTVPVAESDLDAGIRRLLASGRYPRLNRYGDGKAGGRIVELLQNVPLNAQVLAKVNGY